MKPKRFYLLAVIVILVTQLYSTVPVAQAFQGDRTYSMRVDPPSQPGSRRGRGRGQNWCYRRCRRQYSRCISYAGNNRGRRRACIVRYRNCLRRCS